MTTYGEKYAAISEKVDEIVNFRNWYSYKGLHCWSGF
jgi:hypothetical protein